MTATEILKEWLQYADYDPNRTSHKLFSMEYEFHKICEIVRKFLPFDPSAQLAVLYIKRQFTALLKKCSLNAFSVVSDPSSIEAHTAMWKLLHEESVTQIENAALSKISGIIDAVIPTKMLGERDTDAEADTLFQSIAVVAESLEKCNVDLHLKGGFIGQINNFSTKIHVFQRLSDCLLTLEGAPDGIYLCFIRCGDSADGYFGFYMKSNGSILSVNERINESYPGEHSHRRNHRWAENKAYALFPYEAVMSYDGCDYKGYATQHIIDESKLELFELGPAHYMPIVLAMMLLASKYANYNITDLSVKLVDSLLPINLRLPEGDTKALAVIQNSALVAANRAVAIPVTTDDILTARCAEELSKAPDEIGRRHEHGVFPGGENIFVKLWGDGFQLDTAALLKSNRHIDEQAKLLPPALKNNAAATNNALATITPAENPEFVATERGLQIIAYAEGRKQLAEYIRDQMFDAFIKFDGKEGVVNWWKQALIDNKDHIFSLAAEACRYHIEKAQKDGCVNWEDVKDGPGYHRELDETHNISLHWNCKHHYEAISGFDSVMPFNKRNRTKSGYSDDGTAQCCINDTIASHYVVLHIYTWKDMARLVGLENIPKFLIGYSLSGHTGYGNSILDCTDAVTEVGTPVEHHEGIVNPRLWSKARWEGYYRDTLKLDRHWEYEVPSTAPQKSYDFKFHVKIGFSKRAMNKILKGESPWKTEN